MRKLFILMVVCITFVVANTKDCVVYNYDTSTYEKCSDQNMSENPKWAEFQTANKKEIIKWYA